jgi:hypothetical protein
MAAKTGFLDKLVGESVDSVLTSTEKNTFICYLNKPLVLHKRIIIAAPPLCEHEIGFELWITKISRLSQELSIPVQLYCNSTTGKAVSKQWQRQNYQFPFH